MPRPRTGQVQTVLGAVAAEEIGVTLPHEHLLIDFKVMFAEPVVWTKVRLATSDHACSADSARNCSAEFSAWILQVMVREAQ